MNGRQALGCGISAQDRTKTTTKKAANSIVGKLTERQDGGCADARASVSCTQRRSSALAIR